MRRKGTHKPLCVTRTSWIDKHMGKVSVTLDEASEHASGTCHMMCPPRPGSLFEHDFVVANSRTASWDSVSGISFVVAAQNSTFHLLCSDVAGVEVLASTDLSCLSRLVSW